MARHLLADVLTPMGICPFEPLRDDKYTLDVVKAANPIANYALLGLGIVASVVAFLAGGAVVGVLYHSYKFELELVNPGVLRQSRIIAWIHGQS